MRWALLACGLTFFCLATHGVAALEPGVAKSAPMPVNSGAPIIVVVQQQPEKDKDKTAPPQIDLTEAPPQFAEAPRPQYPQMMGDQGIYSLVLVPIPALAKLRIPDSTRTIDVPFTGTRKVRVAVASRGGIKIGENETVMPGTRAYFTYNYYNNVQGPADGADALQASTQKVVVRGQTFDADVFVPGAAAPRGDIHRETFGLEKSFLDDRFSLGIRVPIFQQTGDFEDADLGDISFIVKWAPEAFLERESGSGMSLGLAVTAPTGPDIETPSGELHTTLIQPFLGYQINSGRRLVYGFTSIAIPTDDNDLTVWFNDVGFGYQLLERYGFVRSVIPALEVHVTTPLDHRSQNDEIRGLDLVVLTGGVHLGVGARSLLTLGVATPVTGPRPYDVEALVQFNLRY
ncbi:MAG: hypothetical protein L0Y71_05090 [Gemmataceae bacterium]|nr:hypothetical protein [Gemmataceae bacterium]